MQRASSHSLEAPSPATFVAQQTVGMRHRAGAPAGAAGALALGAEGAVEQHDEYHVPHISGQGAAASASGDAAAGAGLASALPGKTAPASLPLAAAVGATPAAARAPPAPAPAPLRVVPMGGALGDTDPLYVQVDGEAYKVYGLRRLELRWRGRARLVAFA
jgi:hypothetical protein